VVRRERPVLAGLLALVAVALVVGSVLGLATLAGSRVLGLGGGSVTTSQAAVEESLYLPRPSRTERPDGPLITLAPGERPSPSSDGSSPGASPTESRSPERAIALSAGQASVSPMGRIDLTGVYPGGEGAILQVQRREGDAWDDFPVTVSVSNGTFATYVQTGQTGQNRFRVVDTDTGTASNPVTITVG
jgi:hypothetical protein